MIKMIEINIPGRAVPLMIDNVVLDYNGTIAVDGELIGGVRERIERLAESVKVFVLTADTYGTVKAQCTGLPLEVRTFPRAGAGECKEDIVRSLEGGVCAIGNGFNDIQMFDCADLAVAVLDAEGMCASLLPHADVLVRSPLDAMELLLRPDRLRATLRN